MNADTVKVGKKRNLQTAKKIAGQSGLWMAAAAILFLLIVFVKPYHNVIDAIPSPYPTPTKGMPRPPLPVSP